MHFLALPLTRWLQELLRKLLISKQLRLDGIQEVTGSIPVSSTEGSGSTHFVVGRALFVVRIDSRWVRAQLPRQL